ncbi:hypothetical protein ACJX0J_040705 [Zea mays]
MYFINNFLLTDQRSLIGLTLLLIAGIFSTLLLELQGIFMVIQDKSYAETVLLNILLSSICFYVMQLSGADGLLWLIIA